MNSQWEHLPAIFLIVSVVASICWAGVLGVVFYINPQMVFTIVQARLKDKQLERVMKLMEVAKRTPAGSAALGFLESYLLGVKDRQALLDAMQQRAWPALRKMNLLSLQGIAAMIFLLAALVTKWSSGFSFSKLEALAFPVAFVATYGGFCLHRNIKKSVSQLGEMLFPLIDKR